jgi:Organic solute transporter Ostalpha
MICVIAIIQFYKAWKPALKGHKPILQLLCIKIIVILDALQGVSSYIERLTGND